MQSHPIVRRRFGRPHRGADDTETWAPLKDVKESHPVEVAEFAKARGTADELAFAWWVPHALRK